LPLTEIAAREWHFGTWTRGAAFYRAGRFEAAVRCFEAAGRLFRPRPWEWCFLAMAHHRLGHAGAARRCLTEAAGWIDEADRRIGEAVRGEDLTGARIAWSDWYDRAESALLFREAEELLNGQKDKPQRTKAQAEQRD